MMEGVPTFAALQRNGEALPEVLLWVGCAGAFDERYGKVLRAFVTVLQHAGIRFAVLGEEESCTGDPAKRAGHEMLFQMQALTNIDAFTRYGVKKIITSCPHCFNTFRHEYPALGGTCEVLHHSRFLAQLLSEGKIRVSMRDATLTYHDSCYLGRANGMYEAPREVLRALFKDLREMRRNRQNGLCCGAGGAQLFKEAEKGTQDIHVERSQEAIATTAQVVATACPFCMTMLSDGVKHHGKDQEVMLRDLAELVAAQIKK